MTHMTRAKKQVGVIVPLIRTLLVLKDNDST